MLTTLRNESNETIESARDALLHKADGHVCPGCGVPVYPAVSSLGNAFAKCYAGLPHKDRCPCVALANNRQCIDIKQVNLDLFDFNIMTPVSKGTGGGGGGNPAPPRPDRETVTQIKALKDIYQLGLCAARDFELNEQVGLKDLLLNRYTMYTVMQDNHDIGRKCVVAKPDFVIRSTMTIRFCALTSVKQGNAWIKASKVLDLRFSDRDAFARYVDKMLTKEATKSGSVRYKSRYEWVMVYGHWTALDKEICKLTCRKNCNSSWTCTGYQYAECLVPAHQIYCPVNSKIE